MIKVRSQIEVLWKEDEMSYVQRGARNRKSQPKLEDNRTSSNQRECKN